MEIQISWRGCTDHARDQLGSRMRDSVKTFFKRYDGKPITALSIVGLSPERGGDGERLIKVLAQRQSFSRREEDGLRTGIFTFGTQQVYCTLRADGLSLEELQNVIEAGPYLTRRKGQERVNGTETPAVTELVVAEEVVASSEEKATTDEVVSAPPEASVSTHAERVETAPSPVRQPSHFTKGWFADVELVRLFLVSLLERFEDERIVLKGEFTAWIRSVTNFERSIDVGLLVRQLILQKFISQGASQQEGKKVNHYRIERREIERFLEVGGASEMAYATADTKQNSALFRHWSDLSRLRLVLLRICGEYPNYNMLPTAVSLAKCAAGLESARFDPRLSDVIGNILLHMGFATANLVNGVFRYRLEYERIGIFLATGKVVREEHVASPAEPVLLDPLAQLKVQYEALVLPIERAEHTIAIRKEAKADLDGRRAELEAEARRLAEQRRALQADEERLAAERSVLESEVKELEVQLARAEAELATLAAKIAPDQREKLTKVIAALS